MACSQIPARLPRGVGLKGARNSLLLVLAAVVCPAAGLPDFYKRVDRVFWVVDDMDRTVAGWEKLGMIETRTYPQPGAGVRWIVARFANIVVDFIQPLDDKSIFGQYRKKHGQGVMALIHRAPTNAAIEKEVKRLKDAGVAVLWSENVGTEGRYTLLDTRDEGKYVLGLIYGPAGSEAGLPVAAETRPDVKKVSQYAFVARDLQRVSRYWVHLGFPEMSFTHPALWDLIYHGQPGKFDAILGWQRHGAVVYEWIQPTAGPTTYTDHMTRHGEGLHHIAIDVADMEREKSEWSKAGFPTTQSGAWGDRDQPGYGRFAYQDTHTIGGTEIELLWNYRK